MLLFPSRSSGSGRRRLIVWLIASCLVVVAAAAASPGKGEPGKRKKKILASPSASVGEQSLTNIPLPVGHEAKGLVLPDFDLNGRLRGKFIAGVARRIDQEHVGFQDLKITTFTPENQLDLQIDMRTSVLDLKTLVLSSKERTSVKRADFNIEGDSMEFDANARTGRLIGNVKMVISGQSHLIEKVEKTGE